MRDLCDMGLLEQDGDNKTVKKSSDEKRGKGSSPVPEEDKSESCPKTAAEAERGNGAGESRQEAEGVGPQPSAAGSAADSGEGQVADAAAAGAGPARGVAAEPSPDELRAALDRALKEKEELQEQLLRLRADFENFRKRVAKEKADMIQFGNEALLKDLLPVIDNIERVLSSSLNEQDWKGLQEGIRLVLSEMRKTLAQRGLEAIPAVGAPFDPNLHEAIQRVETAEATAATVLEECQKGYLYRGRLLRPSLVVVAVPPESAGGQERPGERTSEGQEHGSSGEPIVN